MSKHDDFERFRFSQVQNANINLDFLVPRTLATLQIHSDRNDVVWLNATVGWNAVTNGTGFAHVDVRFKIFRGNPVTGTLIYSALDTAQAFPDDHAAVTHISHVDSGFASDNVFLYTLTAELAFDGQADAVVTGPITFTAVEIGVNEG